MFIHELDPNLTSSEPDAYKSDKKLLGTQVFGHFTTRWHHGMTYGGLHVSSPSAEKGFINKIVRVFDDFEEMAGAYRRGDFNVVELKEGEEYRPHGTSRNYTHGIDDGTHGRRINKPHDAHILHPNKT